MVDVSCFNEIRLSQKEKIDKEIFRTIFLDHWDEFEVWHPKYDQPQYEYPIQKMSGCGKESNDYSEHIWCFLFS